MHFAISQLIHAASTPSPTPTTDPASTFYSPGTVGFLATFFVTAAVILLIFDMVRRVRRVRYREEIRLKLEAEAQAAAAPAKKPAAKKRAAKKPSSTKAAGSGTKRNK
jgi:hypothetical protein